jgi:metal-responsive CopG/Arc/MetJ family transcriptional regulator
MSDRKSRYTTISIPKELYRQVEEIIEDTGFRSATEYIVFLLRQAVAAIEVDRQLIYSLPYMTVEPPEEPEGEQPE